MAARLAVNIFPLMMRPSPWLRSFRLLAVILQLAVPSLGVVVDADLHRDRLSQPTHIESPTHDCDSRGHPQDCALCQVLRTAAILQPAIRVPLPSAPVGRFDAPGTSSAPARRVFLPLPRGPPVLS